MTEVRKYGRYDSYHVRTSPQGTDGTRVLKDSYLRTWTRTSVHEDRSLPSAPIGVDWATAKPPTLLTFGADTRTRNICVSV